MKDSGIKISRLAYISSRLNQRVASLSENIAHNFSSSDFSIIGAYNTGNIGDLAMGVTLKRIALDAGVNARLDFFGSTKFSPAPRCAVMGGGELGNPFYYGLFQKWLGGDASKGAIIGVNSVANIGEADPRLFDFLRNLRFISQRTVGSSACLQEILGRTVYHQPDITFALLRLYPDALARELPDEGVVGISVCPLYMTVRKQKCLVPSRELENLFASQNPEFAKYLPVVGYKYVEAITGLVDGLIARGYKVRNIPFSPVDDLFARSIFKGKKIELLNYKQDPIFVLNAIAKCSKLYATRFHAHIFGLVASVPTVSIAYSGKCESLWRDLGLTRDNQVDRLQVSKDPVGVAASLLEMQGEKLPEASLSALAEESYGISLKGIQALNG